VDIGWFSTGSRLEALELWIRRRLFTASRTFRAGDTADQHEAKAKAKVEVEVEAKVEAEAEAEA